MKYIKYIILGVIQGLTEPLPISSSGHIFLFKNVFNTNMFNNLDFEIVANFGSFLAILFIFRKDVWKLIKGFILYIFNKKQRLKYHEDFNYCIKIILSTIPVVISGLIFNKKLESTFNSIKFLGFAFLLTALMLFIVRKLKGNKQSKEISIKDALVIGLFEAIAILPGISRSGTVLVACLLCKFNKNDALKYTFMLYFPVSIGAMILNIDTLTNTSNALLIPYLIGLTIAFATTLLSYKWLSAMLKKNSLWKFSIYCLFVALFIFIYFR